MRRGASREDAEDLVQEAFLRLELYSRSHDVREPEAFVVRTAMNLSVDGARRAARRRIAPEPVEHLQLVDSAPRPDEVWAARKRLERLNAGFAQLDGKTRAMLRAQRIEGVSVAEIARRHGVSVSAVEKRLAKGILVLMRWMDGW
jgi:RNA polymerase sigma factor (sigma-70 family)